MASPKSSELKLNLWLPIMLKVFFTRFRWVWERVVGIKYLRLIFNSRLIRTRSSIPKVAIPFINSDMCVLLLCPKISPNCCWVRPWTFNLALISSFLCWMNWRSFSAINSTRYDFRSFSSLILLFERIPMFQFHSFYFLKN